MPAIEGDPMPRFRIRLTLLAAASVVPAIVQAQASSFGSGDAVGLTVQAVTGFEGSADPPAVGLHFTFIRASGPDFDFGISAVRPIGLLVPDVAVGHTFPIGGGALMVKAGPSAVLLVTAMGSAAWWGFHGAAIAFLRLAPDFGIRLEVTPRWYSGNGERLSGATFGIGLTSLPTPGR
jgi:hypothetical protein